MTGAPEAERGAPPSEEGIEEGIVEGATRIFPSGPRTGTEPGPGPSRGPVRRERGTPFYNPAMGPNRDLSVLLLEAFARARGREVDVADVLAGTGARTLRIAREADADLVVHANDADPKAVAALQKGATVNRVPAGRLRVSEGPAHAFLAQRRFDAVDVDPFGSPAPFLDAAVRATRHDGLVCLTATDTGALCGTYPKACRRRYGAEPLHAPPWRAEVGLRILQGAVVRAAGRLDRAAEPVLAVAQGHWMRVVLRMRDSRQGADRAVGRLGYVREDAATGDGTVVDASGPRGAVGGPLWLGPLHDAGTVAAMQDRAPAHDLARPTEVERLLAHVKEEAEAPPFWVPLPGLATRLGLGEAPRRDPFMTALRDAGFQATRTHLDPQGIRTDATADDLRQVGTVQTMT